MAKAAKKPAKATSKSRVVTGKKRQLPEACKPHQFKPGHAPTPGGGRPKGSRVVFAETFLKDFLADWELHGADVIETVRIEDPTSYVKVAASLLPKDFNLNFTNEAALDKLLDQFDDEQLTQLLAGLVSLGKTNAEAIDADIIGEQPDSVHQTLLPSPT